MTSKRAKANQLLGTMVELDKQLQQAQADRIKKGISEFAADPLLDRLSVSEILARSKVYREQLAERRSTSKPTGKQFKP